MEHATGWSDRIGEDEVFEVFEVSFIPRGKIGRRKLLPFPIGA
jgi:hypothetical protein